MHGRQGRVSTLIPASQPASSVVYKNDTQEEILFAVAFFSEKSHGGPFASAMTLFIDPVGLAETK